MFDTDERALPAAARAAERPSAGSRGARPEAGARDPAAGAARLRSALLSGGTLGALWLLLSGFDGTSLVIGGPAVAAGAALAYTLPPSAPWRIAPLPALRFAGFFAWHSVRGALDVARRALDPALPLSPGFKTVILTLRPGPGRVLLANAISLLPGTLSAEIEGRRLIVHTLDLEGDLVAEVADLEARVAAIFGAEP